MSVAKIRLSKKETGLVTDAEWILTKNRIIRELVQFLSEWQKEQAHLVAGSPLLIEAWQHSAPKISRGENYQGLPWIVLDHPRAFAHPGFAAIRVMFWWGRFFSVTLHASGAFKKQLEEKWLQAREYLAREGFYCCVSENEWDHRFEPGNYRELADMTDAEWTDRVRDSPFLKIAAKVPLGNFDELPGLLENRYRSLLEWCRA